MDLKTKGSSVLRIAFTACLLTLVIAAPAYAQTVDRIGGSDRYQTAVLASQSEWGDASTNSVVLVNGNAFPDALSASALCGELRAPLLLIDSGVVSSTVLAEIDRVTPFDAVTPRVILVGGVGVISETVRAQLEAEGYIVDRIGGVDRYETSALITQRLYEAQSAAGGNDWTGDVWLTRGDMYPDGLAVAPYAYKVQRPVMLTRPGVLPATVLQTMQATNVDFVGIVGGTAAVSDAVQDIISDRGIANTRISGMDRYATSVALANYAHNDAYIGASTQYTAAASGEDFPDALAGGVTTGQAGGVMVLVRQPTVPPVVLRFFENHPNPSESLVFGGTLAVSETTRVLMQNTLY
jgi:putative cell wall-binding protein